MPKAKSQRTAGKPMGEKCTLKLRGIHVEQLDQLTIPLNLYSLNSDRVKDLHTIPYSLSLTL